METRMMKTRAAKSRTTEGRTPKTRTTKAPMRIVGRWLAGLAVAWAVVAPMPAFALTGLFFQPQLRDQKLAEADWNEIFSQVRRYGFDTLILQWTRFGPAFAEGAERDWLDARIEQARSYGLRIIIGLAADPDFFSRSQQTGDALDAYLRRLAVNDAALARRWVATLPADAIAGWYLPAEIDDLNWREAGRARQLAAYLGDAVARLNEVLERQVYITSFFTGKMLPDRYTELLASLRRSGVRLWVQDGRGTGVLSEAEARLYLDQFLDCARSPVDAVVHELFSQQTTADGSFQARGVGLERTLQLLNADAPCRGRRIFFSMRYLPGIDRLMGTAGAPTTGETSR